MRAKFYYMILDLHSREILITRVSTRVSLASPLTTLNCFHWFENRYRQLENNTTKKRMVEQKSFLFFA